MKTKNKHLILSKKLYMDLTTTYLPILSEQKSKFYIQIIIVRISAVSSKIQYVKFNLVYDKGTL